MRKAAHAESGHEKPMAVAVVRKQLSKDILWCNSVIWIFESVQTHIKNQKTPRKPKTPFPVLFPFCSSPVLCPFEHIVPTAPFRSC